MTQAIKEILPIIQHHEIFNKHDFRLVGGTALSYHIDHRISEDLDFCLTQELPLDDIQAFIEFCVEKFGMDNVDYIEPSQAIKEDFLLGGDNVEYYLQTWMVNGIKIQFFDGGSNTGTREFLADDMYTTMGNIKIASLETIFKMKSLMFYKRTKSRDLYDMLCLYALNDDRFTPAMTKSLIMKHEPLYSTEEYFQAMWSESFKTKKYLTERDEGLAGLVGELQTFEEMRTKLVKLFQFERISELRVVGLEG
ncbi:MAG: nucleotidyl transferase AbiEii/AbiGii toxin family protein [Sulfurimonadaceae bacterium]